TLNDNSTVTHYIYLNDAGRYLVQIQGGTYFKSVTGASIAMSVSSSDTSYASVSSRKHLRDGTTELFFNYNDTFTCQFSDSDIKYISSASGNISVPSGTELGSSSYICDYSMTITKLD
ncbi:MAG: hypothetical protein PUD22_04580, partial [Erysipelotrichaceae bacterium]|nr:hypothetical protein [Erysipelotrichaceae bacterium]